MHLWQRRWWSLWSWIQLGFLRIHRWGQYKSWEQSSWDITTLEEAGFKSLQKRSHCCLFYSQIPTTSTTRTCCSTMDIPSWATDGTSCVQLSPPQQLSVFWISHQIIARFLAKTTPPLQVWWLSWSNRSQGWILKGLFKHKEVCSSYGRLSGLED